MHVHFDAVVCPAFFVRGFKSSAVGWASEGEKLVEAVSEAFEGAVCAIDSAVAPAGFCAVGIGSAHHHFRNFNDTVEDIAECASEFTSRRVV